MTLGTLRRLCAPTLALVPLVFAACDNPVGNDDHHEVTGVLITNLQGATLAETQRQGTNVVWIGNPELRVVVGEELAVRIYFLDHDRDRFQLPFTGAEYTTRVAITNPAHATFEPHGDHGDFIGVATGATTVRFALQHGGHADFESPELPLIVEPVPADPL